MMATECPEYPDLVAAEPRLLQLKADIEAETPGIDGRYCANRAWYRPGGFKGRYVRLVGWHRNAPTRPRPEVTRGHHDPGAPRSLRVITLSEVEPDRSWEARRRRDEEAGIGWLWSMQAYSVGYSHLYDLLPDCSRCTCRRRSVGA
jgi:hypothetical protein